MSDKTDNTKHAIQDKVKLRYVDINTAFLTRTALAMTEGHIKYEKDLPPFTKNYHKADRQFAFSRLNNAIEHLLKLRDWYWQCLCLDEVIIPVQEDHLGHCAANLNMFVYWEENNVLPASLPHELSDAIYGPAGPEE